MKDIRRKFSALALTALFASMQISYAAIDTGLGAGNGGAVINNTTGGFVNGVGGNGSYDLNFNGNSHVNWDSLNVNKNESLNFNAVGGAKDLTILNTVNKGMSNIYGQISANEGIGKLIISNPNGVLFDGAKFTTVGDAMITTQPMTATFVNGEMNISNISTTKPVGVVTIQDSNFNVGGEFNILAPSINMVRGTVQTKDGLKLITENGQDYLSTGNEIAKKGVRLEAVNIDGNVYIIADKGIIKTVGGGDIKGNLNIKSDDSVALNYVDNGKVLHVKGDVDVNGNGVLMYARNTKVDGNLNMTNGGGFLEVGNVHVGKDMNITTVAKSENPQGYKHFVHVVGNNKVGGNATINSKDNIHIGNYKIEEGKLLDGSLTVGGDLTAHAQDGHVMVTIDTSANKISLKSDNLNVLSDGKATLSANEYEFSANGYIGGLSGTENNTVDEVVIAVMENYKHIPNSLKTPSNMNIAGGNITKIDTPSVAYIASKGDVKLTGANAKDINITAPNKYIEITGDGVHADNIIVGKETDKLKVDFPSRDYTLKYTNIRDAKEVTVGKTEEITYELTNGKNGYNTRDPRPENTTYLVGPDKPVVPTPDPDPTPDPKPDPDPDPNIPDDNENIKVLRSFERPDAVDAAQPYTPVAYAADLDDDEVDTGVRKNVDGSVTVVRAFVME